MTGWKPRKADAKNGWAVQDGVLINAKPGNDLLTEQKSPISSCMRSFAIPRAATAASICAAAMKSEIEDDYGGEPECHRIGGVYGFLTPSVYPPRSPASGRRWTLLSPAGSSRSFLMASAIDRQTIPGITGGGAR